MKKSCIFITSLITIIFALTACNTNMYNGSVETSSASSEENSIKDSSVDIAENSSTSTLGNSSTSTDETSTKEDSKNTDESSSISNSENSDASTELDGSLKMYDNIEDIKGTHSYAIVGINGVSKDGNAWLATPGGGPNTYANPVLLMMNTYI